MKIISEQQTFAKLRIAPADFAELCVTDPDAAEQYIQDLQAAREHTTTRAKKDPTAPKSKRGRQMPEIDLDQL